MRARPVEETERAIETSGRSVSFNRSLGLTAPEWLALILRPVPPPSPLSPAPVPLPCVPRATTPETAGYPLRTPDFRHPAP